MDTVRFGICGTGSFGRRRAKALKQTRGAAVTLGWSRRQTTRDVFSSELDAPTVEHWRDLCESSEVDAVLVCTTNSEHFPHARAALAAGKHVMVEIPLCSSAAQAQELAAMADLNSLVVHHGIQMRHHPDYAEQIEQMRRVGPLLYGIEHSHWGYGPHRRWHQDPALNAGAREFLAFYMPRWMDAFGGVARATGTQSVAEDWSSATIALEFAAGGYCSVGYTLGEDVMDQETERIVGRLGMIRRNDREPHVLVTAEGEQALPTRPMDLVRCDVEAFRDEILGERDHRAPLQTDLRAIELVDLAFGGNVREDGVAD